MLTLFRRSVTQHLMNANPPHKYRAAGTPRAATPKTFRNTPLNFRIPFVRKAVVGVFHHGHLKPRHHIRGGFTGFLKNSTIAAGVSKKVGQRRMARRFALACSYYGITFNQALSVFHKNQITFPLPIYYNLVEQEPLIFRCLMEHAIDELVAVPASSVRFPGLTHDDVV